MQIPDPLMTPGEHYNGFRVHEVTRLDALFAVVYRFEHLASGARILHLHAEDAENAFSINFPTPPPDDTGMPHILEHSVLAGSRQYPVKEPFFEMIKMSMATFINAMTGYDCTYYPVCSNVPRDLFNLAEVYMDAVFHPLLSSTTFQREAHHLAPTDPARPEGPLRIDGIVYSEMKGAFSDPLARLQRMSVRDLLPDTCYGYESGGDPDAIPDLTEAQLKAFHATHYHPCNAYFVCYGNIPPTDYLDFIGPRLAGYTRIAPLKTPDRQPAWDAPRRRVDTYPIEPDTSGTEKTYLALNWRVGDATDPRQAALWHILALALLGNEGAPLRRAIIDAHLGGDLVLAGASAAGPEATFHVGLQGAEAERIDAFRDLVRSTLQSLAQAPLDPEAVAGAFQQAAYHYLEIMPMYPLHAVMRVIDAWIYGGDPLRFLRMRDHLDALRQEWTQDPMLFSRLMQTQLVENPHRLEIVLQPDPQWQKQADARQAQRLQRIEAQLDEDAKRRIAATAAELDRLNAEPNPPEAVAKLPQLRIADLPDAPASIPTRVEMLGGTVPLLVNDVFSNGVVYLKLSFALNALPPELWPYLPRYADAVSKMGAAGMDYAGIARRLSAYTGGLGASIALEGHVEDPGRLLPSLTLSLKVLDVQLEPALTLLRDLLFELDPCDANRARDVALQTRTHYRTNLIQQGPQTAGCHAQRGLTQAGALTEQVFGLPQLALCEQWVREFDTQHPEMSDRIGTLRDFLLDAGRVTASVTGPPAALRIVRTRLTEWLGKMRHAAPVAAEHGTFTPFAAPSRDGLVAPIQIAHCAMLMPAPHFLHPDEPLLAVGTHMVLLDYLMNAIRFQGNAYGAGFRHQPLDGLMGFSSFRDPHIRRTLDVFHATSKFVQTARWDQADVDRAIIGVAKHDSQPIRPGTATGLALQRYRVGLSDALRAERRRRLLTATPGAVRRALCETLEANLPRAAVCVMAGREMLETANAAATDDPLTLKPLLETATA